MELYDISQEVFGCRVFPGDPSPVGERVLKISEGAVCNLTKIEMCAHNGTHVDAPYHFYDDGRTIDQVELERFIGYAYVTRFKGEIGEKEAKEILKAAKECDSRAAERILVGGEATLTAEGAKVFAAEKIKLYGNESQTVGPEDAPKEVHLIMLKEQVVLLEGIRLAGIAEGVYILHAAPLNLGGADGAPCRATLMKL